MRRPALRAGAAAALSCALACRTPHAAGDVPAVLVDPTPAVHAALQRAVSAAIGGAPVTLAPGALTAEPVLVLERVPRRDAAANPLQGRERGRPVRFTLVKSGPDCVLVDEADGRRATLEGTTCAPPPAAVTRPSP